MKQADDMIGIRGFLCPECNYYLIGREMSIAEHNAEEFGECTTTFGKTDIEAAPRGIGRLTLWCRWYAQTPHSLKYCLRSYA